MKIAMAMAMACVSVAGVAATGDAQAVMRQYDLNIPKQSLDMALRDLAQQTHLQIALFSDTIDGNAVVGPILGTQSAEKALKTLLPIGLTYKVVSEGTIAILNPKDTAPVIAPVIAPAGKGKTKSFWEPFRISQLAQSDKGEESTTADNTSPKEPKDSFGNRIQEIIVTARRREENVQKVPIAITVLSPDVLRDNNVQNFQDLEHLVPSLSTTWDLSGDTLHLNIRGQGTNASGIPGVLAYLNEVPIPVVGPHNTIVGGTGLMFDLENAEVLNGPQGTLFGRNAVGGALLLQSARPKNDFGGNVQVSYGHYNDRQVDAVANLPIVNDTLLARVAFTMQQRDGFSKVLTEPSHPNGLSTNNINEWAGRGTITFRPSDRVQNDTIFTYTAYSNHSSPLILTALNPDVGGCPQVGIPGNPCLALIAYPNLPTYFQRQQALGPYTSVGSSVDLYSKGSLLAASNLSRVKLNDKLTFRNIFGFNRARIDFTADFDGTPLPIQDVPIGSSDETTDQYTEEMQLLGTSFGDRFDWIVGGFYLHDYYADPYVFGGNFDGTVLTFQQTQASLSKAVYSQGTYDISALIPHIKLTAGLRYTWDSRTASTGAGAPPLSSVPIFSSAEQSGALGWTVGIDDQISPDTLLYLASRRGYRTGGFNSGNGRAEPNYGPEYVTDGELGLKSSWQIGDIRLQTNADVYYHHYTDVQSVVFQLLPDGTDVSLTQNAAAARVWGTEVTASAQLTHDLELGVTFDSINFRYTEFAAGTPASTIMQLEGTATSGAPRFKYGVNGKYHLPLDPRIGSVEVNANWNWQARQALGPDSASAANVQAFTEAYGLLNLSVNWNSIGGSAFDASFFATNVTDKVYGQGGTELYYLLGYSGQVYGPPRMYGVRLRYRFGVEGN